ncbi:sigma-54-dependent response regulator transcription factor ZraR [Hymenobacter ginsengisoli]|uniref:Sigma-54-dependent response regulator transcription factor ZraR n=1 Tax=Hymenobacter ginsengisoli TaxID=1051626 RepID=A0ABP8QJ41_9BACT|nr:MULTISPECIES: sigma-54 dependent transcriptional regulator [unclassified Hymenobacter]MBO2030129.1 sigma-54-dependent Fis family transcriptional regulator [Hymenobacter sp. BT559]
MKTSDYYHIWLVGPDSHYITRLCHRLSLNPDHVVRRFTTIALALAQRSSVTTIPNALILDSDGQEGLPRRLVRKLRERLPAAVFFVLADAHDAETEADMLAQGISQYVVKDLQSPERLWQALAAARQPVAVPPAPPVAPEAPADMLLGQHASMQQVRELIKKAARTSITVSVSGETGTGKELVAQAIHAQSGRAGQPFVALNMAAIPRELLESELFGHEKGAFTGATTRRIGRFEEANGGTLFLDEIADLELVLQAKLLRVLQERAVTRVGGTQPVLFDVRLIVATHRNLAAEVEAGRFREDLYYRLLGLPIELPPLRQRGQDILLLAEAFVRAFSQLNKLPVPAFSEEARKRLLSYAFPGNVRELKAVVELAAVLADGPQIAACDIPFRTAPALRATEATEAPSSTTPVFPSLREQTLAIMQASLTALNGDVVAAANRLRVGRSTLYRLIQSGHLQLP